jgi:hypothetical protein
MNGNSNTQIMPPKTPEQIRLINDAVSSMRIKQGIPDPIGEKDFADELGSPVTAPVVEHDLNGVSPDPIPLTPDEIAKRLKGFGAVPEATATTDLPNPAISKDEQDFQKAQCLADQLWEDRFDVNNKPESGRVLLKLGETVVGTSGNIIAISAQAKSGKTALYTGAIASTLTSGTFLHCSSPVQTGAVIHFDTEQSGADFWRVGKTTLDRAGLTENNPRFYSFPIRNHSVMERKLVYRELISRAANEHGGEVHSIWIDGAADLVEDVNDPTASNDTVCQFMKLSSEWDTIVVCVIHQNPGSDFKTRGHFGSELERKSEANIILNKDGNLVTSVYGDKMRGAPIPKDDALCFKWDETSERHEVCNKSERVKKEPKADKILKGKSFALELCKGRAWKVQDLKDQLTDKTGIKNDQQLREILNATESQTGFCRLRAKVGQGGPYIIGEFGLAQKLKAKLESEYEQNKQ